MSEQTHGSQTSSLIHLAARVFNTPLAIEQAKYEAIVNVLQGRFGFDSAVLSVDLGESSRVQDAQAQDGIPDGELEGDRTFRLTSDGVAIIPVCGTLVEKSSWMNAASGMCSYAQVASQMKTAMADPQCRAVMLDVDSPGGETHGMFDLGDMMHSMRGSKPVYAVANNNALSAGYAIASAADQVWVTRTGSVGSVGVFAAHIDQSAADEKAGLKYTYVHFGKNKVEGNPHEPLSKGAKADAQKEVDRQGMMFAQAVARNRGMSVQDVIGTQAKVFSAEDAIQTGLADEIGNLADCYLAIAGKSGILSTSPKSFSRNDKAAAVMPVIGYRKTATVRKPWSAAMARGNLREGESQSYYSQAHAYRDAALDPNTKSAYTFIHHQVSNDGTIGAANLTACSSAIAVLNGGRSGAGTYTPAERRGIYNHVAHHQRDAGETPSPLKSYNEYISVRMADGRISQDDAAGILKEVEAVLLTNPALLAGADGPDPLEGEEMAKLTATEEEDLVRKLASATTAAAPPKPKDDEDEDDQPDDEEDDDEKKKDAKAAAAAAATPPAPAKAKPKAAIIPVDNDDDGVFEPPRGNAAMEEIMDLCSLEGLPIKTAMGFVKKNMSLKEVIANLQDRKEAKPSNRLAISTAHDTSSAGLPALDAILRTTVGLAAQQGINRPHAMARAMEIEPELYKAYCDEQQDAMESRRSREAYMAELTKRIGKGSMILSRNTITPPQA